jgi:hypothetical protein
MAAAAGAVPDFTPLLKGLQQYLGKALVPGLFAAHGWGQLLPDLDSSAIAGYAEQIIASIRWEFYTQYALSVNVSFESARHRFHITYVQDEIPVRLALSQHVTTSVRSTERAGESAPPCALDLFSASILGFDQVLSDLIVVHVSKTSDIKYLEVAKDIQAKLREDYCGVDFSLPKITKKVTAFHHDRVSPDCGNYDELRAFMETKYSGQHSFDMQDFATERQMEVCSFVPVALLSERVLERDFVKRIVIDDSFAVNSNGYYLFVLSYLDRFGCVQALGYAFLRSKDERCHTFAIRSILDLAGVSVEQIETVRLDG